MSISVGDASSIVQAGVGVAGVLGTAIAWVWAEIRRGRRRDELRFKKIEGDLEKCRERENRQKTRSSGQLTIIEILILEVRRFLQLTGQRHSPALTRAKALMDKLKIEMPDDDPGFDLPEDDADLADMADEIDRRNRHHG